MKTKKCKKSHPSGIPHSVSSESEGGTGGPEEKPGRSLQPELRRICMCEPYGETSYSELCVSDIQKVLRQKNLPDIRFHDLRHSCATMLLSLGFSMKAVQEQLGHTQYATTANTCAHVYDKTKHEIAVMGVGSSDWKSGCWICYEQKKAFWEYIQDLKRFPENGSISK